MARSIQSQPPFNDHLALGSRCKRRPGEGTRPAWGAETDNKQALLGTEEKLSSEINSWLSNRRDNSLCGMERKAKTDSTVTTVVHRAVIL